MDQLPVLIVGAGPSGLTMAAALHQQGIQYRIIEKLTRQTQTSNAAILHSRTLEMLDDMDIIDPFLKQGQHIDFIRLYRGRVALTKIRTAQIESHYNYLLSIPQNISEEILNNYLQKIGTAVERNQTLTQIQQTDDGMIVEVINENQKTEKIYCQYLIACDGAHSTVRDLLEMDLSGIDISEQFVLADAYLSKDYPDNGLSIYFHEEGPLVAFPFQKRQARIVATILKTNRDPKQPVSLLEIQKIADKRSEGTLKIIDSKWMSTFYIHSKMLKKFRKNNVFFVGDAAHIHSPVGGQGMNTGMQDAYNLAWKLALTLQGHTNKNILDSYEEERKPNASILLANTEYLTRLILIRNPILQWLRYKLIRFLTKEKHLQHAFIMEISMLSIHYEKSPIINYEFHVSSKSPLAGHRAPDVNYTDRQGVKRMHDLLRSPKHTLLIFTGKNSNKSDIINIRAIEEWAVERNGLVNPVIIVHPNNAKHFSDSNPLDKNNDLHIAYNAKKTCFFMIRPDGYIGCCSAEFNMKLLNNYWNHLFVK